MPVKRRPIGQIAFLAAVTLVLAAILHILTILAIPHFATRDAWSRITAIADPAGITLLPRPLPGDEPLPGLDPSMVYGVCLYDLTEGPLAISAPMPDHYWSVAFHTRDGIIFYAVNDEAAVARRFDIELRDARQMRQYRVAYPEADETVLTIEAPSPTGFALFRALVAAPSLRAEVEAAVAAISCTTLLPTQPAPVPEGPPLPPPHPLR